MQQHVTPELRQWIIEQATTGFPAESILESMKQAGWAEDTAIQALEDTMKGYLQGLQQANGKSLQVATRFPFIDLEGRPRELDLQDRRVQVLASVRQPQVVVIGGLLTEEECDALIAAAQPRMQRSLIVQTSTGGDEESPDRTSRGMFFERGENPVVARVEERLSRLVGWPVDHGEGMQVLHYRCGAEYKPHYDYFDPDEPGTPTILKRGGQRLATLVMYLNNPARGGGTVFPDLKLEIAPQKGSAVFFSYPVAHPASQSLHGGAPLLEGEKWVATKWFRAGVFT
ncbi:2OG-Fe(II) oxygenase [Limnohabitans sp.]|uniref:2OG-Fe(II) oxygenase n=1 Tax=Limnohabitans sp. TaxID=1907725 RepID=UPI00391A469B